MIPFHDTAISDTSAAALLIIFFALFDSVCIHMRRHDSLRFGRISSTDFVCPVLFVTNDDFALPTAGKSAGFEFFSLTD